MRNELVTFVSPKTVVSEVFRALRTNIQFMDADEKLKSILITSTMPEEGKSWVSANLAVTFAQAGKRVLIVDADMRKGRQHKIFEVDNSKGLSNYLTSESKKNSLASIGDYIEPTKVENLFIMTSGMVPPNPSELLMSQRMLELIKYLEEVFDIVIFDGTPSTIVTDAIILSRFVDTSIIVASYRATKAEDLNQVKRNIVNVGGKIAGVILNKVPATKKEYKTGYYYEDSGKKKHKSGFKLPFDLEKTVKVKPKKLEELQIKEVSRKLDEVENVTKSTNTVVNVTKVDESVDLDNVLKQLSQFIADKKK